MEPSYEDFWEWIKNLLVKVWWGGRFAFWEKPRGLFISLRCWVARASHFEAGGTLGGFVEVSHAVTYDADIFQSCSSSSNRADIVQSSPRSSDRVPRLPIAPMSSNHVPRPHIVPRQSNRVWRPQILVEILRSHPRSFRHAPPFAMWGGFSY